MLDSFIVLSILVMALKKENHVKTMFIFGFLSLTIFPAIAAINILNRDKDKKGNGLGPYYTSEKED